MENAHAFLHDLVWNRVLFKCHLSKQADDDTMFSYTSYWYIQLFSHVLSLKTKSHNSGLQQILNMMCFCSQIQSLIESYDQACLPRHLGYFIAQETTEGVKIGQLKDVPEFAKTGKVRSYFVPV